MTETLIDPIEQFLDWCSQNGMSHNTIRAYRADLKGWKTWTPDLTAKTAAEYVNAHRTLWSPKTCERKVGTIRTFSKFIGQPMLAGYRTPKTSRPVPHPLPGGIEDVRRIVEACAPDRLSPCAYDSMIRRRALVAFCGLCGLRVAEALSMTPAAVTLADLTITVRGKGDVTRVVPLSTEAIVALAPVLGCTASDQFIVGLKDRQARAIISHLGRKAGIGREVSSHDLRATFATAVYDKTKDIRVVQELLGHASAKTTEVYIGVREAAMRKAVEL